MKSGQLQPNRNLKAIGLEEVNGVWSQCETALSRRGSERLAKLVWFLPLHLAVGMASALLPSILMGRYLQWMVQWAVLLQVVYVRLQYRLKTKGIPLKEA
jgi:hypothetical protein